MRIGIDIDETLAVFMPTFIDYLRARGVSVPSYEDTHSFNLWEPWKCSREEISKRVVEFYGSDAFRNLPTFPDALRVVPSLAREHELHAITSRCPSTQSLTQEWIRRHFPECFTSVTHTDQYSASLNSASAQKTKGGVSRELGIELFVEDALHHATECASQGIRVLLLPRPWNQGKEVPTHVERVTDWHGVRFYVEKYKNEQGRETLCSAE